MSRESRIKIEKYIPISCYANGSDAKLFIEVWNQGIDAHLQAFVKSKHRYEGHRLRLDIHKEEVPILLRRLRELNTEEADSWADDIESLC